MIAECQVTFHHLCVSDVGLRCRARGGRWGMTLHFVLVMYSEDAR